MSNSPSSIGQPLDRLDGRLKVTGRARYSAEMNMTGLVHGVIVSSTIARGRVESYDTAEAEKLPGVLAIFTPANLHKLPDQGGGVNQPRPTGRVVNILQDDLVHYAGQPVAVAVADTFERAVHAAKLVRVRYREERPLADLRKEAGGAYTPKGQISRDRPVDSSEGDAAAGLDAAAARVEATYVTPMETHTAMEPHATVAVWEAPDKLTVFDATQGVHTTRKRLAGLFGLPEPNVRVLCYFLGGGFGSKGPVWSHTVLAAMCAQQLGRPVKIVLHRRQNFNTTGFRPECIMPIAFGASAEGKLTGMRHDVLMQTSTFDEFVEPAAVTTRLLYDCPNIATTHRLVRLNYGTPSFMRAPGEASGTFPLEAGLDELAFKLKMDPLELRLRNYAENDASDKGRPWSSKNLRECYRVGAEKFGWSRRHPEPRSMRTADGKYLVGLGMATATYPTRRSPAKAIVRINADGTAVARAGTQDLGTGTYTIMTQIAADALGLPVAKVRFELGDSDYPETPVSGGSQTAASTGSAVHNAALAAKQLLAAALLNDPGSSPRVLAAGDEVLIENGRVFLKSNPSGGLTFNEIVRRAGSEFLEARGEWKPEPPEEQKHSMHSFGAQFCEVRVDPDFGEVRVARWTGVFSAGRMLNAKTARSQLIGGIVYGIGMALTEETVADRRDARLVNPDLAEYHVPVNADVPDLDVTFLEERDEHVNPIGVKGIGEIGITGVAAALSNAVFHATGKRVRDLPITLDKLLA